MRTVSAVQSASRLEFCTPGLLDSLIETQTRLWLDYRNIQTTPDEEVRELMRAATAFFELLYVYAVGIEVAHRHGATNAKDIELHRTDISREICALTKLSLDQVFKENAAIVSALHRHQDPAGEAQSQSIPQLKKVVSVVNSILQVCPAKTLVDFLNGLQMTEHGSRCQVAFDGLYHFTRRNDEWMHQRLKVVGVDYTLGKSSIEQVAEVLDLPIVDTVAMLEDHGYSRPLEQVTLSEGTRSSLYERLRQDRANRSGKPQVNPERVARSVVASQRIEGIDARPWVDSKLT